jgi:hypothetical protein
LQKPRARGNFLLRPHRVRFKLAGHPGAAGHAIGAHVSTVPCGPTPIRVLDAELLRAGCPAAGPVCGVVPCSGNVRAARGKVRTFHGNLPCEERGKGGEGGKRRATRWSECFRMVLYPVAGVMLWCLHLLRRRREGPGPLRRVGIRWRADRRRLGNRLADRSEVSGTFPLGKVPRFVKSHEPPR